MAVTAVDGLVVGIDTHLDVHVAAVLNRLGQRLAVRSFPATDAGNAQLTRWLDRPGPAPGGGGGGPRQPGIPRGGGAPPPRRPGAGDQLPGPVPAPPPWQERPGRRG